MGVIQSVKESFARAPQGSTGTTNGMLDEDLPTNTNTQKKYNGQNRNNKKLLLGNEVPRNANIE